GGHAHLVHGFGLVFPDAGFMPPQFAELLFQIAQQNVPGGCGHASLYVLDATPGASERR
ncbi:MAG: hypothetical protein JWO34_2397, partial [Arthrobacter sp.]|nr:hypothetical protein [Arthrobacter sp.]